jgi:hypothetical protein
VAGDGLFQAGYFYYIDANAVHSKPVNINNLLWGL